MLSRGGVPKRDFARKHDIIYRYGKTDAITFNVDPVRIPYSRDVLDSHPSRYDKSYRPGKVYSGYVPNPLGKHPEDWWLIQPLMPSDKKERLGYPTQKPLTLLDRIILASSNEGDVVLDPFSGCATACVAAERLHREWVGIDISEKAAELVQIRVRQIDLDLFHDFEPIRRTDIPRRTDQGKLPNYRTHKHQLFGKQEGLCGGCGTLFAFRNFTIDHIVPQSKGGSDHMDNLQLLCGACNSTKGSRTQAELIVKLKADGVID